MDIPQAPDLGPRQFIAISNWLIRLLPALKYPLGAMAFLIGVAITTQRFGLTARTAVFGGLIGLGFTIAIFLFSKFTEIRGKHVPWVAKIMVGTLLFLFLLVAVMTTSSAFFGWPLDLRGWLDAPRAAAVRAKDDEQLARTIDDMTSHRDYKSAWDWVERRAREGPLSRDLRVARAKLAMAWSRNLGYDVGTGENFVTLTNPLISAMREGMGDVDPVTRADLSAHLAWDEYLRDSESLPKDRIPPPAFDEAFALDPKNVFGRAFAATWIAQNHKVLEPTGETPQAQAARYFALALQSGRERPFVRGRQLESIQSHDIGEGVAKLQILDEMRRNGEPLPAAGYEDLNGFIYTKYRFGSPEAVDIEQAMPPADFLKTLEWLAIVLPPNGSTLMLRGRLSELAGDKHAAAAIYLKAGERFSTVQEDEAAKSAARRCLTSQDEACASFAS